MKKNLAHNIPHLRVLQNNFPPLLRLLRPLVVAVLVDSSGFFFVTSFLAHLSHQALAAASLVFWVFNTFNVIIFGILGVINILVSHHYGADDRQAVALLFRDGLWLAALLAIPLFLIISNISTILLFFRQDPSLIKIAYPYSQALSWGVLPHYIVIAVMEFSLGIGNTRFIMLFCIFIVLMKILLGFLLIFGEFGFPLLGIAGAGWAETLSHTLAVFIFFVYGLSNKKYRFYMQYLFQYKKPFYLYKLIKLSLPLATLYCLETGYLSVFVIMMGWFGKQQLAANQIAMQYFMIWLSIFLVIAQAITVRMGHLLGKGKFFAAKQVGFTGAFLSSAVAFLVTFLCWFAPHLLISVDLDVKDPRNQQILSLAIEFLAISGIFQLFQAVRIALFGALRALYDLYFCLFTSVISLWCVGLPAAYFMAEKSGLGGVGLWWGMTLGAGCAALLLLLRFNFKIKS